MRVAAIVIGLCVVSIAGASVRLFIWPAKDDAVHADAIVALAGDIRRQDKAVDLARAGYSHIVIASLDERRGTPCPKTQPGMEIICFRPEPCTTQGEARYVGDLAAEHDWRSIVIVPGTTQAARARLLFKRGYSGQLFVVPARESVGGVLYNIAYEWGALGKALLLRRGC
jgi:hypothetical protein